MAPMLNAQDLPEKYQIDGSVSVFEHRDDPDEFITVLTTDHYVIKENDALYYIGIQSNTSTIANLYIMDKDNIKVMHASAAVGEHNYVKSENIWTKDRQKWDWRHRDMNIWDKLHAQPLQDMNAFYKEFGWFSSTISNGSYREWEFLVSKELLKDIKNLGMTFFVKQEDKKMVNEPEWFDGVTADYEINVKLHMGDMEQTIVPR